jgi:MFS-type transporter involved in bile tolerance (Atg22 family)
VACGLLAIPALYIPFRLTAQKYNTALTAGLDSAGNVYQVDNFAHPLAILIWPAFAVLCGSLMPFIAKRVGTSWIVIAPLVLAAFILTYLMPWVDELVGIPNGGLYGFVSWPANHDGMTTPKLSAMLCPFLFWASALLALVVATALNRKEARSIKNLESISVS